MVPDSEMNGSVEYDALCTNATMQLLTGIDTMVIDIPYYNISTPEITIEFSTFELSPRIRFDVITFELSVKASIMVDWLLYYFRLDVSEQIYIFSVDDYASRRPTV